MYVWVKMDSFSLTWKIGFNLMYKNKKLFKRNVLKNKLVLNIRSVILIEIIIKNNMNATYFHSRLFIKRA